MKIERDAIKKYISSNWFDAKKSKVVYGVMVVMVNNKKYHCYNGKNKYYFFEEKKEAIAEVKKLNKELKVERSVATMPNR